MVKAFVETSVFMRFLTADDPQKFKDCVALFDYIEQGKIRPYTSNIVILEILFLLIKLYKFPKTRVLEDIKKILNLRNITVIEKTNTKRALKLLETFNIKNYADCFIATQIPPKTILISFDQDFTKFKLLAGTPAEVNAQAATISTTH